jgi:hypothetical protein
MSFDTLRRLALVVCLAVLLTVALSWQLQASTLRSGGAITQVSPISPVHRFCWLPLILVPHAPDFDLNGLSE